MTFYQELQLNAAGSKALIRITEDKKERKRHVLIYNFKVYLVVAFCFAAVTLFSLIFGNENSIAGVAILLASLLGIPRVMWVGIACMSVCLPFQKDLEVRAKSRGIYNIAGCLIFLVIYTILPKSLHSMIGIIGGIGVGYSAKYPWQTVFNTFGALSNASGVFGAVGAVILRISTNAAAAVYTAVLGGLFDRTANRLFQAR